MRVMIFFDLPTETAKDRRHYSKFRKFLINEGFIMIQESVYAKLTLNSLVTDSIKDKIYKNKPPKGIVQILAITEKQFNSMEYVIGEKDTKTLDSLERMTIL